jgi:hypothetical protein
MPLLVSCRISYQLAIDSDCAIEVEKREEPTVSEIRAAIRALRAYKDAIYWFPKEEEAEGGIHEMMGGLEVILQAAIKTSRKLPPNSPLLSEEATTELHTSVYQLVGISSLTA